jgi:surfactin synthase thioesterase subunit
MHRKHEKLAHMQILIRIRLFSIPYAGGFSLVFPALMHTLS